MENILEELFAEDFRMLFGDERAQGNIYSFYNAVKPPTEKDREFILELAGKHTALAPEGRRTLKLRGGSPMD